MKEISPKKGGDYIGAWGNVNNLREFSYYFEKRTKLELTRATNNQNTKSNYYAWLIFKTLYLSILLTSNFARFKKLEKKRVTDYEFRDIPENFKPYVVKKLMKLRTVLFHGGVPNRQEIKSYKEIPDEEIDKLLNPLNFKNTIKIFEEIENKIKAIPQPSIPVKIGI